MHYTIHMSENSVPLYFSELGFHLRENLRFNEVEVEDVLASVSRMLANADYRVCWVFIQHIIHVSRILHKEAFSQWLISLTNPS